MSQWKEWLEQLKQRGEKEIAERALEKFGNSLADDLEKALLGKVGAADDLAKEPEVDPLDRLRAAMGEKRPAESKPALPSAPPIDPEAKARLELEELKRNLKRS